MAFESKVFQKENIALGSRDEWIVRRGRHLFPLFPKAFEGIRQFGVLGWSRSALTPTVLAASREREVPIAQPWEGEGVAAALGELDQRDRTVADGLRL
jgi:ketol-acid reductoisomerase